MTISPEPSACEPRMAQFRVFSRLCTGAFALAAVGLAYLVAASLVTR